MGSALGALADVAARRLDLADRVREPPRGGRHVCDGGMDRVPHRPLHAGGGDGRRGSWRTTDLAPSAALHCLAWKLLGLFRLGRWDEFSRGLDQLHEMLGPRRDAPPLFAARPFAASVLLHEIRGERQAADRVMAMLEQLEQPTDYPPSWSPVVCSCAEPAGAV